jgi:acyl-CoA synthetase (AMP-forming)/AMP-acid ligase II
MGEWLPLSAARYPSRRCFVDEGLGRTLTFSDVNDRVNRLANGLREWGIDRGERVAILAVDSHCFMETLLACMKLGVTYVPLNYRLAPGELALLLDASGARWLFVSPQYELLGGELVQQVASLERIPDRRRRHSRPGLHQWHHGATKRGAPVAPHDEDDGDQRHGPPQHHGR